MTLADVPILNGLFYSFSIYEWVDNEEIKIKLDANINQIKLFTFDFQSFCMLYDKADYILMFISLIQKL